MSTNRNAPAGETGANASRHGVKHHNTTGALKIALQNAANGHAVFPFRLFRNDDGTFRKVPCIQGWKDGQATTDESVIRRWWRQWPDALPGLPTGQASGVIVIDLDVKHGIDGIGNWTAWADSVRWQPSYSTVSGGQHIHFRLAPGDTFRCRNGIPLNEDQAPGLSGVDVKADGGFAGLYGVLPAKLPKRPEAVAGLLQRAALKVPVEPVERVITESVEAYVNAAIRRELEGDDYAIFEDFAPENASNTLATEEAWAKGRNNTLNEKALKLGHLAAYMDDPNSVREQLARQAMDAGLSSAEVYATLASGWETGEAQPYTLHPPATPDRTAAEQAVLEQAAQSVEAALGRSIDRKHFDHEVERLLMRKAASEAVAKIESARIPDEPFDAGTVRDLLARPPEPQARIEGLLPWSAGVLVVAQRKAGKTTLALNLSRSLLTGEPFLGTYAVQPVSGNIAFLNYEVSAAQIARWADRTGVDLDRLFVVNLRGKRNPFTHEGDLARLAALLRQHGTETLIVDPFSNAYSGTSQNDPGEVRGWLDRLDMFARSDVGALDVVLTAHAGWSDSGRARGASALEDWGDAIWNLKADERTGIRQMKAFGRDVTGMDAWTIVDFDCAGMRLGQPVTDEDLSKLDQKVLVFIRQKPGVKAGDIKKLDPNNRAVDKSVQKLKDKNLIYATPGPGNSVLHYPVQVDATS